jgi:hypothetical protein
MRLSVLGATNILLLRRAKRKDVIFLKKEPKNFCLLMSREPYVALREQPN